MRGHVLVIPSNPAMDSDWVDYNGPLSMADIETLIGGTAQVEPGFDCVAHDGKNHKGTAFIRADGERYDLPVNDYAEYLWKGAINHAAVGRGEPPAPGPAFIDLPHSVLGDAIYVYGDDEFMAGLK
jgi:hypothetical protein